MSDVQVTPLVFGDMIDLSQLTPESILGNLPFHDFQVDPTTLGHLVAARFEQEPDLPGVIIAEGPKLLGMISRQKFWQHMSQRYSLEIHLKRPIRLLLDFISTQPLVLPDTCKIDEAAERALARPATCLYEPIVIGFRDQSLRLLDLHVLLLAQSRMLALVNQTVQQQKLEVQNYLGKLRQAQIRTEQYNRILEAQKVEIEHRNHLLEKHQAQLLRQSEEITQLNQCFIQIGQILSREGKKAFQATSDGVEAICRNTDQMVETGKALAKEIETVQGTSDQIKTVSKQARFLSLQAAILASKFGSQLDGVSRITSDIGQLSHQTFEAGQQMDDTANRLQVRIGELTRLAREGATVAQALIEKVSRAELALTELEQLVKHHELQVATDNPHADQASTMGVIQSLKQKVEHAGMALLELEKLATPEDLNLLSYKADTRSQSHHFTHNHPI